MFYLRHLRLSACHLSWLLKNPALPYGMLGDEIKVLLLGVWLVIRN
jgi:hypothetical protein